MKAISLWQPWASLWLSPRKIHETRHWPTKYRGWLLVHAAKRFEKDFDIAFASILRAEFGAAWFRELPCGAIIGAVYLSACHRTEDVYPPGSEGHGNDDFLCGNFEPGRFAWQRGGFRRFATPIPYRGAQGFFDVQESVLPLEFRKVAA